MDLSEELHKARSSLSASSIKTYTSILRSLHGKVFGKDDAMKLSDFKEHERILEFLKNMPANRRKTILSALVVLTDENAYRTVMNEDVVKYNHEIQKQELSPAQEASWVSQTDIKGVFDELAIHAKMLYAKKTLKPSDLQDIQKYVLMAVSSGIFIPPRRLLDYCCFKIKNINKTEDNYLDKNTFVFNHYKTSKTYGQQTIDIPKELRALVVKWIKINPTDWLFFDTNMNCLNAVKMNQRYNLIFGGKVSTNNLRHSYLTAKFGHMIEQKKAVDTVMSEMGSSENMLTCYVKKI